MPTEFSEIWVPLGRTQEVMEILHAYFTEPEDDHEAYRRTGLYAWELYAAKPTSKWMAASHTSGEDEWRDGALRIDPYWFAATPGDPAQAVLSPDLEADARLISIPFRLHWGKFQPIIDAPDRDWVDFFRPSTPAGTTSWRCGPQRDPPGHVPHSLWRDRFGLWDA